MSADNPAPVWLDQADALEIAEACQFVVRWLTVAPPAVAASLDAYAASAGYLFDLRDDLARFAELLVNTRPTTQ